MAKNPLFRSVLAIKHHWFCRIGGINAQKRGFHRLFGQNLPKNLHFQHLLGLLPAILPTGGALMRSHLSRKWPKTLCLQWPGHKSTAVSAKLGEERLKNEGFTAFLGQICPKTLHSQHLFGLLPGIPAYWGSFWWGFPPSAEARPQRESRDKTHGDDTQHGGEIPG